MGDLESKLKSDPITILDEVWTRYLPWAKEHKKTWHQDLINFRQHLDPRFGRKRLHASSRLDVEKMKIALRKGTSKQGKPYSMATIKEQLVLLKRLYHLARGGGFTKGRTHWIDWNYPVSIISGPSCSLMKRPIVL